MASEAAGDAIYVAITATRAIARVQGRASFKMSGPLKEFGLDAIARGLKELLLDMEDCVSLDSTFMGVLAGLAFRMKKTSEGQVVLLNLSPKTHSLIRTLGLDRLVKAYRVDELPDAYRNLMGEDTPLDALERGAESQLETAQTMLEAHENLLAVSDENRPRFKDVLSYLRDDIRKKSEES